MKARNLSILLPLLAAPMAAFGQSSATASANATATVYTAIALAKTHDLAFGNVFSTTAGGTVTVSSAGVESSSPTGLFAAANTPTAASFTVGGANNAVFAITLPSSASLTSGSNTMTVNTFTSSLGASSTLSAGGTATLDVGANLVLGASQAAGSYTGSFSVTVAYQ